MKDQYCGDVNDFRKYGILRQLVSDTGLSLCVFWMLTPGDRRSDGKHTAYLAQPERWRHHDPSLFDELHAIVSHRGRAVRHVEQSQLFPGVKFHSEVTPDHELTCLEWFARSKGGGGERRSSFL